MRNKNSQAGLGLLFKDYPPSPPHDPDDLTRFLANRDTRLDAIASFLRIRGVKVEPMFDPAYDGLDAAHAVDAWLNKNLPKRPFSVVSSDETPNADTRGFRVSNRAGEDINYSFVADLGLLEAEAIRRRDPRFDWVVNRIASFSDISSFGRICLIKAGDVGWAATAIEMDEYTLTICHAKMAPSGNRSGHRFGELLEAAITRAFDPP